MKKMLIMATLALMCIVSCEKRESILEPVAGESVLLNVSVPSVGTKCVGDVGETVENAVNNLQVFVFLKDGTLDTYARADNTESLSLRTTVGTKDIVAIVNSPVLDNITTLDAFKREIVYFYENSIGNFVMTGMKEFDVSPENTSVTVEVARKVSKIYLRGVSNKIPEEVLQGKKFIIKNIYLINVPVAAGYLTDYQAGMYNNKGKLDTEQTNENVKSLLQDLDVNAEVTRDKPYTTLHTFYTTLNAGNLITQNAGGQRCTKLVIEATIGDEVCYYPVALASLYANRTYDVIVHITRRGIDDPDGVLSLQDETVSVNVVPWRFDERIDAFI